MKKEIVIKFILLLEDFIIAEALDRSHKSKEEIVPFTSVLIDAKKHIMHTYKITEEEVYLASELYASRKELFNNLLHINNEAGEHYFSKEYLEKIFLKKEGSDPESDVPTIPQLY